MDSKRALFGLALWLLMLLLAAHPAASGEEGAFDGRSKPVSALEGAKARPADAPQARRAPAEESVWVSFGREDLRDARWSELGLGEPAALGERSAIYELPVSALPELAQKMHERFHRCGGFFAHATRREAEGDLRPHAAAPALAYTVDQKGFVGPLLSQVKEAELRAAIEILAAYHNRYYQSETGVAAAKAIQARWQQLVAELPGASARLVTHGGWKQPSVVLTIPGSESPDELVVLGGHLDSIAGMWGGANARAPGADDNASGIAVLTEAIRVLGRSGLRPKRTIEFMGYAAEEVGLRGSQEIARQYASAGKKVVGVVQFDMTNFRGSADDIYVLSDNVSPALSEFLGRLVDEYALGKRGTTRCGYACSDHASWTKAGFPASAAFESSFDGMNKQIHTDRDTLANSGGTAAHSAPFARLAVAFAVELAKNSPPASASGR